jgi:hypothetical protein
MDYLPKDASFRTICALKNYIDFKLLLNFIVFFYFEIVFHVNSAINTPPCFKV